MFAIADLTDSRDPETGAHLERTRNYCVVLADKLSRHPRYKGHIDHGFLESIYHVSPLHDVGKVAVPDAILLKPGRLDAGEYEIMKTHAAAGADAFAKVLEQCDTPPFPDGPPDMPPSSRKMGRHGLSARLAGDAIPLEARVMSFADVYDALRSKRVYKPPMTREATPEEIRRSAGTFFDPVMTEVLLENIDHFETIHDKFQD
jgi:response regulator RpfG family c-di-GMP phosphodiesterase